MQLVSGQDDQEKESNSSDYGSDFTPDEEELLNKLLVRVVATDQHRLPPSTTTISDPSTPPQQPVLAVEALSDLKPLREPLVVTDIEDYEIPHSARIPKVLGREAWSPASKRVWQQQQQQQQRVLSQKLSSSPSTTPKHVRVSISVESTTSTEGKKRDLQKQQEREKKWTDTEAKNDTQTQDASDDDVVVVEQPSPLQRFRKPPNKALSVSDLIAPAWCELQYWYTLTKHGRKRRTPAMKQGTAVHKVLEEEVHTTVPVEITTKEDGWALRIWNMIQGLRTLRQYGMTRELEIWGSVDGEIVTGIIDQLSYICPDPGLETSASAFYADADAARAALPEYQMSITDYLLSPSQGGKTLGELGWSHAIEPAVETDHNESSDFERSYLEVPRIYITDIKTRGSRSIPTVFSTSFRPTHLQLQFYYHMLNQLVTTDDVTIEKIAQRYNLDSERVFTDAFIAEVGGLNDQFFDALSSQDSDPDYIPGASQDSMSILLSHNNLDSLWKLMKKQLLYTFLPTEGIRNVAPSVPAKSQPTLLEPYPTVLSPVLTAKYLSSTDSEDGVPTDLGSRSFLFDPLDLTSYTSDQLNWWRGERAPRGVEVMDAWKCRICDFREECEWRKSKERELATRRKRMQRTSMDMSDAA
ncbi:exonuclease V a 5' deoxyribonuclease-domain-containing protein [Talaromyces proteolyticus]|uniref:Exonuclease V a 5' deoxyribonuclease-domain-containing protein n=1 Tax=Talaromyces proteolyticus TaxID=1131652 RepID=A0AAD4PWV5_9EURO|nr:exonuclease V a 5' deoxyribonuclease-domain-containing protein [Talaromyces proteolyticus]KAH8698592.1 exonuclease V a 5' deoxyribonuclease-domain-containing protein [Talaromyces proteolyticus]